MQTTRLISQQSLVFQKEAKLTPQRLQWAQDYRSWSLGIMAQLTGAEVVGGGDTFLPTRPVDLRSDRRSPLCLRIRSPASKAFEP